MMQIKERNKAKQAGFTLVELMIVIVIVSVLVAIGLPAYQNQLLRSHRAAAKAEILEIANRQEHYLLSNRTYTSSEADLNYSLPSDVSPFYSFSLSTASASSVPYFKITFTAKGSQVSDGELALDSEGVRTPPAKWER